MYGDLAFNQICYGQSVMILFWSWSRSWKVVTFGGVSISRAPIWEERGDSTPIVAIGRVTATIEEVQAPLIHIHATLAPIHPFPILVIFKQTSVMRMILTKGAGSSIFMEGLGLAATCREGAGRPTGEQRASSPEPSQPWNNPKTSCSCSVYLWI